jgi:photosystem II stability/assembly factor-like uncharacterized protein
VHASSGPAPDRSAGRRSGWRWQEAGTPYGGTVTAVAVSPTAARDCACFAATMAGLYRSQDLGISWRREPSGFDGLSLTAVAVSPDFAEDGFLLVAGLESGIFRVRNGQWLAGDFGGQRVTIVALAISPAFAADGACFAATMADGVFHSRDRGAHWEPCTFGLLDLDVIAIAISPEFARDDMVAAATASGLFRSPNGGLAWRELALPVMEPAVLCVAFSPAFAQDGTLFAGTDGAGLFRSRDRGATWHALSGPWAGHEINGIACSPAFAADRTVTVATGAGLYLSRDGGENWADTTVTAATLCVAVAPAFGSGGPILAGLAGEGIARSTDGAVWHAANQGLAGRLLTALALSPTFATDRRLVAYGANEGLLCSEDGGRTWKQADDGLPSSRVSSVAIAAAGRRLFVALPEGIWASDWQTLAWERIGDIVAHSLCLSPAWAQGTTLVAGTADGQIWVCEPEPVAWRHVEVPWEQGRLLALAVTLPDGGGPRLLAAIGDAQGTAVSTWQGTVGGGWWQLGQYTCAATTAHIAVCADDSWYVAVADQVLGPFVGGAGQARQTILPVADGKQPAILDLAVLAGPSAGVLLAASTRGLYVRWGDDQGWESLEPDDQAGPIIALAAVNDDLSGDALALAVGGSVWRLRPPS